MRKAEAEEAKVRKQKELKRKEELKKKGDILFDILGDEDDFEL